MPAHAIAAAVESEAKPILVWLEFQDCAGNTESFLRAGHPTVADLILDIDFPQLSRNIMAAAGSQAEDALAQTVRDNAGKYIVAGRRLHSDRRRRRLLHDRRQVRPARSRGRYAEAPRRRSRSAPAHRSAAFRRRDRIPTGALSVADAVPGVKNLINMSACPANAENLTALIVYYLTLKRWPPLDQYRRPLFAYGKTIHDNCERRAHFDAGQYVEAWGDEAHRQGHCLYKMGCKGPATSQNCPVVKWNEGTNWPIGCGHPCIGCAEPNFWDTMTPFYQRLPDVDGFDVGSWVDPVGLRPHRSGGGSRRVAHGVGEVVRHHHAEKTPSN